MMSDRLDRALADFYAWLVEQGIVTGLNSEMPERRELTIRRYLQAASSEDGAA
jgi:hypothetical protein